MTDGLTKEEIDRCKFWVSANRKVKSSKVHNFQQERIQVNHQYNFEFLEKELEKYPDREVLDFMKYGWPLNADNTEKQKSEPVNQRNARINEEKLEKYIREEIRKGTAIRPFHTAPFEEYRVSPVNAIPKKDSDQLRVLLNLSHPFKAGSVNHSISKANYVGKNMTLKYPTVDHLVKIIRRKRNKNEKVLVYKVDLSQAYKQMFMDPGDIHLLGYRIGGYLYFDVTLSMGSRSVAYCCQATTNTITYITRNLGNKEVNYLDDFGGADTIEEVFLSFKRLKQVLEKAGLKEAEQKAVPPSEIVTFLGILFNTITLTLTITPERLQEIKELLRKWESKTEATLNKIQSLLGKLAFACSTIRAGRIFVSRLINWMKEVPRDTSVEVDPEIGKDLRWWNEHMTRFDGVSIMPQEKWISPKKSFATDACLKAGGAWFGDTCFYKAFPESITCRDDITINELELLTIVISIKIWMYKLKDQSILIFCDNQSTVDIINKGKAKNKFSQKCLREICWLTAEVNAMLRVVHRMGKNNEVADKLSRAVLGDKELQECHNVINEHSLFLMDISDDGFSFSHDW